LIRGVLAASEGDTATGIEEIKLAYDFDPRDEEAAYQLGMAYLRAGNCRAALPMFKTVGELKGTVLLDNVPLLLPMSLYRIAECNDRLGNAAAAKTYYSELAKIWAAADSDLLHAYPAVHE
jgi:TolA-binding protein